MATPVTGGIAILGASLLALFGLVGVSQRIVGFGAAALLIVAIGVLDDRYDLRWYWRILAQVIASLIAVYWGGARVTQLNDVFGPGSGALGWFSVPFTVFAIVGLINAMNMIDGVDGLAGSLGLAALLMLTVAAIYAGNIELAERLCVLCGALLAFLAWNMRFPWQRRARVFLGNSGSALLGLMIAWASFRLTQTPAHPVNSMLALWFVPVPVIDCLVVSTKRMARRHSPFDPGFGHIHHIMRDAGFTPTATTLLLALFSFVCGLTAALLLRGNAVTYTELLVAYVALGLAWFALSSNRGRAVAFFGRFRHALHFLQPGDAVG